MVVILREEPWWTDVLSAYQAGRQMALQRQQLMLQEQQRQREMATREQQMALQRQQLMLQEQQRQREMAMREQQMALQKQQLMLQEQRRQREMAMREQARQEASKLNKMRLDLMKKQIAWQEAQEKAKEMARPYEERLRQLGELRGIFGITEEAGVPLTPEYKRTLLAPFLAPTPIEEPITAPEGILMPPKQISPFLDVEGRLREQEETQRQILNARANNILNIARERGRLIDEATAMSIAGNDRLYNTIVSDYLKRTPVKEVERPIQVPTPSPAWIQRQIEELPEMMPLEEKQRIIGEKWREITGVRRLMQRADLSEEILRGIGLTGEVPLERTEDVMRLIGLLKTEGKTDEQIRDIVREQIVRQREISEPMIRDRIMTVMEQQGINYRIRTEQEGRHIKRILVEALEQNPNLSDEQLRRIAIRSLGELRKTLDNEELRGVRKVKDVDKVKKDLIPPRVYWK